MCILYPWAHWLSRPSVMISANHWTECSFRGAVTLFCLHACAVECCDLSRNMSASMVRATVRAVSKRKILPTRAALTLVRHKQLVIHSFKRLFMSAQCELMQKTWLLRSVVTLRDPELAKLANQLWLTTLFILLFFITLQFSSFSWSYISWCAH